MSFEQTVADAVERAFQRQVMPLLQPVLEQMKMVNLNKPEPVEELWDTGDVAKYLKVAKITVELWRVDGRGPTFGRVGNRVRYKKSNVIAFAERNKGLIGRKGRPPQALVEQVRSGLAIDGVTSQAGRERRNAGGEKAGK